MILSLGQMPVVPGNRTANLEWAHALAGEARRLDADLLLLPEVWLTGYKPSMRDALAIDRKGMGFAELTGLAKSERLAVCGSFIERDGARFFISLVLLDSSGSVTASYRKVHLFSLSGETTRLAPGSRFVAADMPWGKTGLAVCYDLRFPEQFRALALRGAALFLVAANWPEERIAHWDVLLRARAVENVAFVAGCNRMGEEGGLRFPGGSMVVGPRGDVLACAGEKAGLLTVEFDPRTAEKTRAEFPVLADARASRKRGLG